MVLRWVFSGSSVNHVFSEKKPKSHRDKEEGREIVNATWTSITLSVLACVLSAHRILGGDYVFLNKQLF